MCRTGFFTSKRPLMGYLQVTPEYVLKNPVLVFVSVRFRFFRPGLLLP